MGTGNSRKRSLGSVWLDRQRRGWPLHRMDGMGVGPHRTAIWPLAVEELELLDSRSYAVATCSIMSFCYSTINSLQSAVTKPSSADHSIRAQTPQVSITGYNPGPVSCLKIRMLVLLRDEHRYPSQGDAEAQPSTIALVRHDHWWVPRKLDK